MKTWGDVYRNAVTLPGVTAQRFVLLERRILFAKVTVVAVVLATVVDGKLGGYVADASWPLSMRAGAFGELAARQELCRRLGLGGA